MFLSFHLFKVEIVVFDIKKINLKQTVLEIFDYFKFYLVNLQTCSEVKFLWFSIPNFSVQNFVQNSISILTGEVFQLGIFREIYFSTPNLAKQHTYNNAFASFLLRLTHFLYRSFCCLLCEKSIKRFS